MPAFNLHEDNLREAIVAAIKRQTKQENPKFNEETLDQIVEVMAFKEGFQSEHKIAAYIKAMAKIAVAYADKDTPFNDYNCEVIEVLDDAMVNAINHEQNLTPERFDEIYIDVVQEGIEATVEEAKNELTAEEEEIYMQILYK